MNRRSTSVRALLALAAIAAVLTAGACTKEEPTAMTPNVAGAGFDAQADALWEHRTAHVGDNSTVIALVSDAGFGAQGSYLLSLQTAKHPYGLTIRVTDKPTTLTGPADLEGPATKLLGTIGNLERVTVVLPGGPDYALTAEQASAKLGFDVKQLGHDHEKLTAYVTAHPS